MEHLATEAIRVSSRIRSRSADVRHRGRGDGRSGGASPRDGVRDRLRSDTAGGHLHRNRGWVPGLPSGRIADSDRRANGCVRRDRCRDRRQGRTLRPADGHHDGRRDSALPRVHGPRPGRAVHSATRRAGFHKRHRTADRVNADQGFPGDAARGDAKRVSRPAWQ